jgi:hypothetical protein
MLEGEPAREGEAVADQALSYTLWKHRPGTLLGDKQMASGQWYFNLCDKSAMTAALDVLIDRHGKGGLGREAYWLELTDPVTGQQVRRIVPLEPAPVNGGAPGFSLQDVPDEVLVRELARRLAGR